MENSWSMSSKLRPLVSGSRTYTNTHAATAAPAYRKKHPAMETVLASEMKVMLRTPDVSRFTAVPRLVPRARSRSGRISALYACASGLRPTEHASRTPETRIRVIASEVRDTAMPAVLARRSGRGRRRAWPRG